MAAAEPRTVLVTGGTSGLGRATVEALAAQGHEVFTCGRNATALAELNALPRVRAHECDVSDEQSVVNLLAWVAEQLQGRELSAVVNNAGLLRIGDPMLAMPTRAFEEPFQVNVRGPFLVTREAWPLLQHAREPLVVNIGSTTEHPKFAQAFHTLYAMSKVALRAYSTGLRQELAVLHPGSAVVHMKVGAHSTPLNHDAKHASEVLARYGNPFARLAPAFFAHLFKSFKMVRYHPATDVADAICRLVAAPARRRPREVWVNVSFVERLVEWLPQSLMDFIVVRALRAGIDPGAKAV